MPLDKSVTVDDYGISGLASESSEAARAEQINRLENALQDITDKRLQDRFYFVTAIALLLDILMLPDVPQYLGIFILAVEAIALLSLAEKWGVEQVGEITKRLEAIVHKHCEAYMSRNKTKENR